MSLAFIGDADCVVGAGRTQIPLSGTPLAEPVLRRSHAIAAAADDLVDGVYYRWTCYHEASGALAYISGRFDAVASAISGIQWETEVGAIAAGDSVSVVLLGLDSPQVAGDPFAIARASQTLVAYCDAEADCIVNESAVIATDVKPLLMPSRCVGIEVSLLQPEPWTIYNNGTNSYGLLPRTRGAWLAIDAEDSQVAANRMSRAADFVGTAIADGPPDLVALSPGIPPLRYSWDEGAVELLHVGFQNMTGGIFNNSGAGGGVGDVVTGGTPIARYMGARLVVRAVFEG